MVWKQNSVVGSICFSEIPRGESVGSILLSMHRGATTLRQQCVCSVSEQKGALKNEGALPPIIKGSF